MAVAEYALPIESEAERPHLRAAPESEEYDLGMPEYMATKMRNFILDETIEVKPSGRNNRENYDAWTKDEVIAYGEWVCALLGIEFGNPDTPDLTDILLERMSKLDFGPSITLMRRHFEKDFLTSFKLALGAKSSRFKFKGRSQEWCVEMGTVLADNLDKRPSAPILNKAQKEGVFPGEGFTYRLFGNLSVFHERIGRPSSKTWAPEDYIDWGVAFIRQNGLDQPMTASIINRLCSRGRGPNVKAIIDAFEGGRPEFDRLVLEEYLRQTSEEKRIREEQLQLAQNMLRADSAFAQLTDGVDEDRLLTISAKYQVMGRFLKNTPPKSVQTICAQTTTGDAMVSRMQKSNNKLRLADIEIVAEELEVFDYIWPGHRFGNADLRIAA